MVQILTLTSDKSLNDVNFHLMRLRSLLSKDMSRSGCSYQTTTALHLIGVIVEEWLFAKNPSADRRATGHDVESLLEGVDASLLTWARGLHRHSVESRYDHRGREGKLSAASRHVTQAGEADRGSKPRGDEGKIMGRDFAAVEGDLATHIGNLHALLMATA